MSAPAASSSSAPGVDQLLIQSRDAISAINSLSKDPQQSPDEATSFNAPGLVITKFYSASYCQEFDAKLVL